MLDIKALKAEVPSLTTGDSSLLDPRARIRSRDPRDYLLRLIDNTIELIRDPNYRVMSKRSNKLVKPATCVQFDIDGNAYVWLSYFKRRLKLTNEGEVIVVPYSDVITLLEAIKMQVGQGKFDVELATIQRELADAAMARSKAAKKMTRK